MPKNISFNIKLRVDGQDVVVTAKDIDRMTRGLTAARNEADRLGTAMARMANVHMAMEGVAKTISGLQQTMQGAVNAYAIQEQAETRLATVMRERMDATEGDIQKMKELASTQQALGVISDEVQLVGMQQLATFLKEQSALETLVPAMNNLLAQQKGLNVTQQDAQNIGNMFGKVMQPPSFITARIIFRIMK